MLCCCGDALCHDLPSIHSCTSPCKPSWAACTRDCISMLCQEKMLQKCASPSPLPTRLLCPYPAQIMRELLLLQWMLCNAQGKASSEAHLSNLSLQPVPACGPALGVQDCQHALPCTQAGLGVAVRYANELGLDWIWERIQQLAADLRSKLRGVPGVTVHDRGRLLCGIVSFTKVRPPDLAQSTLHTSQRLNLMSSGSMASHDPSLS